MARMWEVVDLFPAKPSVHLFTSPWVSRQKGRRRLPEVTPSILRVRGSRQKEYTNKREMLVNGKNLQR